MSASHINDRFATTHWSVILAAKDRKAPEARQALAELCTAYWYPLYAFIRRKGYDADQAQDLTQEFFFRLLEKDYLRSVDPAKGRFRSFLLAAASHFLANEHDRTTAAKRGGGRSPLSLDFSAAEGRYRLEPMHHLTAEKLFERRFAMTLLEQTLQRLRQEMVNADKEKIFDSLKSCLIGITDTPYAELAAALEMTEGAIKTAVHRLRNRYGEMLREAIARTVTDESEIEDEIRTLFVAVSCRDAL
jgi:RNA polymerase sigma-70 factor (ECF subfamily)